MRLRTTTAPGQYLIHMRNGGYVRAAWYHKDPTSTQIMTTGARRLNVAYAALSGSTDDFAHWQIELTGGATGIYKSMFP